MLMRSRRSKTFLDRIQQAPEAAVELSALFGIGLQCINAYSQSVEISDERRAGGRTSGR